MFIILDADIPRGERTVTDYANALMTQAGERCLKQGLFDSHEQFTQQIVLPVRDMCGNGLTGEEVFKRAIEGQDSRQTEGEQRLIWPVMCICFAIQALIAEKNGEHTEAWTYLLDAAVCRAGIVEASEANEYVDSALAARSKAGTDKQHKENRALKQDAIDAYVNGNIKNKNVAANAIAGKVVPLSFETVRKYLRNIKHN